MLKKLTATYLTLGLADIAKVIKVESEVGVRNLVLNMVRAYFHLSLRIERYQRPDMSSLNRCGLQSRMKVMSA